MKLVIDLSNEIHALRCKLEAKESLPSFEQVVAKNMNAKKNEKSTTSARRNRIRTKPKNVVIVRPKEDQSHKATLHDVKSSINPKAADIEVQCQAC